MITIGISGFSSNDNPGPGVGIARSLRHDGLGQDLRVVGLCYDAMETGILAGDGVDKTFLVPYPSAGPDALEQRLGHIKRSYGLDFVIPSLDSELPSYVTLAPRLAAQGIQSFLPSAEQFRLRGKEHLVQLAQNMGVEAPRTEIVASPQDLWRALEALPPPIMVKGAFYKALAAHSVAEALGHFHAISAEWGMPVLIQQMVAGEEVNLVAVGDGEGGMLGAVSMKKMNVTAQGKVWTGVSIHHSGLKEAARRFVAATRWRGPFELECMAAQGKLFLIEINPRFPAWCWLSTALGVNLPAAMLRQALNLSPVVLPESYQAGQLFIRSVSETVVGMDMLRKLMTAGEC